MTMTELMPSVPLDMPADQDVTAVAIFAHGFGDTTEGQLARALSRELPRAGIAVARVPLADQLPDSNDLLAVPFLEQAERLGEAVEAVQELLPDHPLHLIGHSQGTWATAQAAVDYPERAGGAVILFAPPVTGPAKRLGARLERDVPALPNHLSIDGLMGYVSMHGPSSTNPGRRVAITEEFWQQSTALKPRDLLADVCATPATHIVLAGADEVLGSQEEIRKLPRARTNKLMTVPGANHEFSNNGNRTKIVRNLANYLCSIS